MAFAAISGKLAMVVIRAILTVSYRNGDLTASIGAGGAFLAAIGAAIFFIAARS